MKKPHVPPLAFSQHVHGLGEMSSLVVIFSLRARVWSLHPCECLSSGDEALQPQPFPGSYCPMGGRGARENEGMLLLKGSVSPSPSLLA